ncbi:cAMP-dependent protein kinase type II regulatory subunit-like isoform X2 [Agrilus planipennis]|uniref:cAMP-dependent protein kinase type II-alpha regulatory subunit n=1 Tax=Agrilus planipennis TaxID=224129 RepID=A0A1W4WW16_AGRPL|nr:cAMP-dependent protein kinase type II regulatory subunit-like isoform X2 [Agrilus planipennis]
MQLGILSVYSFAHLQLNRRPLMILGSMESNTSLTPLTNISSSSSSTYSSHTTSPLQQIEQEEDEVTISASPQKNTEEYSYLMDMLRNIPRFSTVDEVILKDIVDMMYPIFVSAGDTVFDQADPRNNIYVIEQGIFHVITLSRDTCQEEILYVYSHQGNFGQMFVRENCPIPASVRAVTNGVLWIIEGRVIHRIIAGLKKSTNIINN